MSRGSKGESTSESTSDGSSSSWLSSLLPSWWSSKTPGAAFNGTQHSPVNVMSKYDTNNNGKLDDKEIDMIKQDLSDAETAGDVEFAIKLKEDGKELSKKLETEKTDLEQQITKYKAELQKLKAKYQNPSRADAPQYAQDRFSELQQSMKDANEQIKQKKAAKQRLDSINEVAAEKESKIKKAKKEIIKSVFEDQREKVLEAIKKGTADFNKFMRTQIKSGLVLPYEEAKKVVIESNNDVEKDIMLNRIDKYHKAFPSDPVPIVIMTHAGNVSNYKNSAIVERLSKTASYHANGNRKSIKEVADARAAKKAGEAAAKKKAEEQYRRWRWNIVVSMVLG